MKLLVSIGFMVGLVVVAGLGFTNIAKAAVADGWYLRSASWCGPCNSVASKLGTNYAGLEGKLGSAVKYVNADNPSAVNSLINTSNPSVPNLVKVENGVIKESVLGPDNIANKIKGLNEPLPNKTICVVPRPGQDESFGPLTDDPAKFPTEGKIQDTEATDDPLHPVEESKLNFDLRKLGSKTMPEEKAAASANPPQGGKQIVITPNAAQAQQYVTSMGGNPTTRGSYTIGGTKVPVGQYEANVTNDRTGIVFDESCENPKQGGKVPEPGTPGGQALGGGSESGFGNPSNGGGSGGGGSGGGGGLGGGGLGGMESLLPLMLMQSLLGGGKGQGQNGAGNQGQGSGITQQQSCAAQGTFPVCGSDGKTYTNTCYAQQYGVSPVATGTCSATNSTSQTTPDLTQIVTQLVASGVPQSMINTITSELNVIFKSLNTGSVMVP
jgi:uncharacterized membrane protein YgcG